MSLQLHCALRIISKSETNLTYALENTKKHMTPYHNRILVDHLIKNKALVHYQDRDSGVPNCNHYDIEECYVCSKSYISDYSSENTIECAICSWIYCIDCAKEYNVIEYDGFSEQQCSSEGCDNSIIFGRNVYICSLCESECDECKEREQHERQVYEFANAFAITRCQNDL